MPNGTIVIVLPREPEEVFSYVADLERAPEWVPDLISVEKLSEGPVGVGTRYREVVQVGGKRGLAEVQITAFEPPRVFAHEGWGGPSRFSGHFSLEPCEGGTRLRHEYSVEMTGFAKMMNPLIKSWVRKNVEAATENLERALSKG